MTSILKVSEIQDPTNGNTALSIDSSGRIEMPQIQVAFQSDRNSSVSISTGATYTFVGSATFDKGSNYNATNGRFTAPFAGVYSFHAITSISNNVSGPQIYFQKNGSGSIGYGYAYGEAYQSYAPKILVELNANDYINFIVADGNSAGVTVESLEWGGYLLFKT